MAEKRYEKRRLARIRKRQQKKQMRRRVRIAGSVLAAVTIILSGRFLMSKMAGNSNAMGTEVVEPDYHVEESVGEESTLEIEYVTDDEYAQMPVKMQAQSFQDRLDCFLVVKEDTTLYARNSTKSNVIVALSKGTYVETYGTEGEWTKVSSAGREGYVRNRDLDGVMNEKLFKVVDGRIIVNAKYGLDANYETVFNENAAAGLRVMLEAMERDDLHVEVAATYRNAEEEKKELVLQGNPENAPKPGHAVFQTGYGVQFYVAGTDPRLDNDFEQSEQYAWLMEHSKEYGFILRYPEGFDNITGYRWDPTIFYYVGIEDAQIIMNEEVVMEQFYGVK